MTQGYVRLLAGELVEALKRANPRKTKRHKAMPVSFKLLPSCTELLIGEAKYGLFEHKIPATGNLTSEAQADGAMIHKIASSYAPTATIDLVVEDTTVTVVHGRSRSAMPRIDGPDGKKIKRSNPPPDPRHKGRPEEADRLLRPDAPQSKTWAFSAHMAPRAKK